ncbi:UDP-glucose 4-epimerase GalE [Candidatus Saccharibacteria bacterium]|nr:UDP-glucose 4-epimerase GalE [Candidatus Saccharibacteria bacterium]
MKILLTGGTGYIGSHTAVELIQAGFEVEILDNLANSKIAVLDKIAKITGVKPKFYEVDLLDASATDKVLRDGRFDAVIHLAGLKAVGESVEKPLIYYKNNVCGTINLLESMKRNSVNKMIFSSSATVYGDKDGIKLTEDMETGIGITNPYGETKYVIEKILMDVANSNNDFEVTILRYFNPIGAHSSGLIGEDPNGIPNNLMPIIMKVATGEIPKLMIYGDDYNTPDGTGMRDYIHVVDLAKGHVKAVEKLKPGVEVYNLGTGEATSVKEIVKAFEDVAGKELPNEVVERRAGDLAKIYADCSKAERELGWSTELNIKDAMRDTINYLRHYEG